MRRVLPAALVALACLVVPASADVDHAPVVNCYHSVGYFSNVLLFGGEAHSPLSHDPATSMSITCSVMDAWGRWFSASQTLPGPAVAAAGAVLDWRGVPPWQVCSSAAATYADGHTASSSRCTGLVPSVETGPPPHTENTSLSSCQHTRGAAQAWAVAAVGVAPVRPGDVAIRTTVQCTITDVNGQTLPVEASALGPVAVASGAGRLAIAPLASKCWTLSVEYVTYGTWTDATHCDSFDV